MRYLVKWLITVVLALVVMLAIISLILPSAFSTNLAIVYSGSMNPKMPAGSVAVMHPVDPAVIVVGDIIAFNPPWDRDVIVSHRVKEVRNNGFVTKGDANEGPDPFIIPAANVISRVDWHVPYVGYVLDEVGHFTRSIWGVILLIALPTVVIFGSALKDVGLLLCSGKRRERLIKRRQQRLKRRLPRAWRLRRIG